MAEPRHVLTIRSFYNGHTFEGHLLFDDGSEASIIRRERAQVIAWAQAEIQAWQMPQPRVPTTETLVLDQFGEIVRDEVAA